MSNVGKVCFVFAIIFTLVFCVSIGARKVKSIEFNHGCEEYLKRAADANTVEMAKEELSKAIDYAEENNLTEGIVSVIFKNPKNDIGYWYKNMKASYEELDKLPEDATSLEKTNVLMKLRETLTDDSGDSGTSVTIPEGISVYPNNVMYAIWGWVSFILAAAFWIAYYIKEVILWSLDSYLDRHRGRR